jgi:ubiquinone/menaquinone biosynthesis C-methylase UbiE
MKNSNLDRDLIVAQHFDEAAGGYAKAYTDGSFFSYYFKRRLDIVLSSLQNYDRARILDVGCGPGMMAEYSIKRDFEFFGIDISEKMIDECINKFGHVDSTNFSVGKLQSLEFKDSFFDVVLCMGALEYVNEDEIENAFSEMIRVLKPGGQIIVSLMNKGSFFAWHRKAKNYISMKFTGHDNRAENYDHLSRSFNEIYVRNLLMAKRLAIIDVVFFGLNVYPYFLEWRMSHQLRINLSKHLDNIIRGRFKWPYMAFIVKAKK